MRQKRISDVLGRDYIFDGDTLDIYEDDGIDSSISDQQLDVANNCFDDNTYLRTLVLNLTNNCNLTCGYCYARQGKYDNPGIKMDYETACKGVDLVMESVIKNNGTLVTIGFFGGEPLLAFELIKKIVHYVKKKNTNNILIRYLITTNGTCLTTEQADYFQENNFQVMLSIDGDAKTHNRYRVYSSGHGSYQDVIRAIDLLLPRVSLEARITIADKNTDIAGSVMHIRSLGIKRITYALDYKLSEESFAEFIVSLRRLFEIYLINIKTKQYFDLSNITEPIVAIVLNKKKRSHCNSGVSYLSLSADGSIYRCPRFTDQKLFSLGKINENNDLTIAEKILNFRLALGEEAGNRNSNCLQCAYAYLCGGMCFHHAFLMTGKEFDVNYRECYYKDQLYTQTIRLLCIMSVAERRDFLLFLNQFWQNERR